MPPVIGIIAGAALITGGSVAVGMGAITALTATSIIGSGVAMALSGAVAMLNPPPPVRPLRVTNAQVAIQQPIANWRVIYGHFQAAGITTFIQAPTPASSTDWEDIHLVYTLCCHEIVAFLAVVLDGLSYAIGPPMGPSGGPLVLNGTTGYYEVTDTSSPYFGGGISMIGFEFSLGNPDDASQPFPRLVAEASNWNAACLQQGRAKVHVKLRYKSSINAANLPNYPFRGGRFPNIEFNLIGKPVVDTRLGGAMAWQPLTFYKYPAVIIDPGGFKQLCSSSTGFTSGTAPPTWNETPGGTTAEAGVSDAWLNTDHTGDAKALASNPALVVYDYLTNAKKQYGMGVDPTNIDLDTVNAAANACESQVSLIEITSGGAEVFEQTYSCDGMFDSASPRGSVLQGLLGSMAGYAVPPGDLWRVYVGGWVGPEGDLTDDDLRDTLKGDFRMSRRTVCNAVRGTFTPRFLPTNSTGAAPPAWQSTDFPAYFADGLHGRPDYIASEDGGELIYKDVQFDFTTSLWACQRLAKIKLMQLRQQETLTLPCKLSAWKFQAGSTVTFTHSRWGYVQKQFIVTQLSLTLAQGQAKTGPELGVDLTLRATDHSVWVFQAPAALGDYGEYSPYGQTGVEAGGPGGGGGGTDLPVARPTTFTDIGTVSTITPANAYDDSRSTEAILAGGNGEVCECIFSGFVNPVHGVVGDLVLYIDTAGTAKGSTSFIGISYSLDGGSTWHVVYLTNKSRARTRDWFVLAATQDFTLVQVRAEATGDPPQTSQLSVFDIDLEFTLT